MMTGTVDCYDLIVVGGGSAGMAAAIYAAQRGKRVIVLDAAGPGFDKPCGEGLMPPAIIALAQLGVRIPESYSLSGVTYFTHKGQEINARFFGPVGAFGVRRRLLRKAMWTRAQELGVVIKQQTAESVVLSERCVQVDQLKGKYLCVATGAHSRVLREIGIGAARRQQKKHVRIGMRRHARIAPWGHGVEVYWRDQCELYVTPVSPESVNIAILSWEPFRFEDALNLFPEVITRLGNSPWEDEPSGRAPLYHRSTKVQMGRVMIAGDAAMFIDAMTGEGNTLALRSGIAVAKAVIAERPSLYRFFWFSVVWRYWMITAPALWASGRVQIRRALLSCLTRMPSLLQMGVSFLSAQTSMKNTRS